jgi:hypothetical protein
MVTEKIVAKLQAEADQAVRDARAYQTKALIEAAKVALGRLEAAKTFFHK